jgi:uracil-DNA glycosylase family 4
MFVGEQPGDSEDKIGLPFVGPAGKLLDEALVEVGIDRSEVYVTNVVKHFKCGPQLSAASAASTRNLVNRKSKRAVPGLMRSCRL